MTRKLLFMCLKNPNAVITLRNRKLSEMWSNVTVVAEDMRTWVAPEQAEIMVWSMAVLWV
jgi:hypothetical protein